MEFHKLQIKTGARLILLLICNNDRLVPKLQHRPPHLSTVQFSRTFWAKCRRATLFLLLRHMDGWPGRSADKDKDNTDSRTAVDDSRPQQMRLRARQQPSPCHTTRSLWPITAGVQMTGGSSGQPVSKKKKKKIK